MGWLSRLSCLRSRRRENIPSVYQACDNRARRSNTGSSHHAPASYPPKHSSTKRSLSSYNLERIFPFQDMVMLGPSFDLIQEIAQVRIAVSLCTSFTCQDFHLRNIPVSTHWLTVRLFTAITVAFYILRLSRRTKVFAYIHLCQYNQLAHQVNQINAAMDAQIDRAQYIYDHLTPEVSSLEKYHSCDTCLRCYLHSVGF